MFVKVFVEILKFSHTKLVFKKVAIVLLHSVCRYAIQESWDPWAIARDIKFKLDSYSMQLAVVLLSDVHTFTFDAMSSFLIDQLQSATPRA